MSYKQLTQKFFLIIFGLVLFLIIPLVSYDPLHLYHKSWFNDEAKLHNNMRLQAAGIINNYEFDSMIVGTSMLAGTSSLYASNNLGGTFVNLSAPAGTLYERNLIMKHALRKKNIKNIIYSFDTGLDANLKKNDRSLPLRKFDYLYDDNPFNDFYVYWNNKFMKCLLTFSSSSECIGGDRGLIRPQKWFESTHENNKNISGIANWINSGRGHNIYARVKKQINKPYTEEKYERNLKLTYKIIDEQLLDTIKQNKNVSFHIVFPPYARLQYALWLKYNPLKYSLYKKTIQYLVEASKKYDNMFVYLLDDLTYLDNLDNYRDMRHYNTEMNTIIINYIRDQKYIRTMKDLNLLFQKIDLANKSYHALEKNITQIINAYKFKYKLKYYKDINNKTTIEGWALSYKVTNVELHLNGKKIKSMRLKKREDIFAKYPHYNQIKSGFLFKNVELKAKQDKLSLIFKNKNRIIKKIAIKDKEGIK